MKSYWFTIISIIFYSCSVEVDRQVNNELLKSSKTVIAASDNDSKDGLKTFKKAFGEYMIEANFDPFEAQWKFDLEITFRRNKIFEADSLAEYRFDCGWKYDSISGDTTILMLILDERPLPDKVQIIKVVGKELIETSTVKMDAFLSLEENKSIFDTTVFDIDSDKRLTCITHNPSRISKIIFERKVNETWFIGNTYDSLSFPMGIGKPYKNTPIDESFELLIIHSHSGGRGANGFDYVFIRSEKYEDFTLIPESIQIPNFNYNRKNGKLMGSRFYSCTAYDFFSLDDLEVLKDSTLEYCPESSKKTIVKTSIFKNGKLFKTRKNSLPYASF